MQQAGAVMATSQNQKIISGTKTFVLTAMLMLAGALQAQVSSVQLALYQGCGGATAEAKLFFVNGVVTAASVTLERQNSANIWAPVVTRPYTPLAAQFEITASEVTAPTYFRVTVLDQVNGQTFISNNVIVTPATWNSPVPAMQASSTMNFGTTCATNVFNVFVSGGRGPYTFEYKKQTAANWTTASSQLAYEVFITGVQVDSIYQARVTDRCGNTVTIQNMLYVRTEQFGVSPTNCTNGQINIVATGVEPRSYALIKYEGWQTNITPTVFSSQQTYSNLSPGIYYIYSKDACGTLTNATYNTERVVLGAGFPEAGLAGLAYQTDSCFRDVTASQATGFGPFEYSFSDPQLNPTSQRVYGPWQTSRVFDSIRNAGLGLIRVKDGCGTISDSARVNVPLEAPEVFSHQLLPNELACFKEIVVGAGRGYLPYEYGYGLNNAPTYTWQQSDTIQAPPGLYQLLVRDRCKNISYFSYNYFVDLPVTVCPLRTQLGDYESSTAGNCTTLTGDQWIDMKDDLGNVIYSINPNNNTLNNVCWGVRVMDNGWGSGRSGNVNGLPLKFLDRNVYIQPAAGTIINDSVSVRMYITRDEFYRLQSVVQLTGPQINPEDLIILKIKGTTGAPSDLDVTNNQLVLAANYIIIRPKVGAFGDDYYLEFKVKDFSEFNPFYNQEIALPLDFLSFAVNRSGEAALLTWSTENEVNTSRFDVQWSTDGRNYRSIGTVSSLSTGGVHQYDFTHNNPSAGINYYRIRQLDIDGKSSMSTVVILDGRQTGSLQVSPNPVSDKLRIRFAGSDNFR
ncbi:MAG: hypothetical protein EOO09_12415, partial [Chitinophagaceae bacterium]